MHFLAPHWPAETCSRRLGNKCFKYRPAVHSNSFFRPAYKRSTHFLNISRASPHAAVPRDTPRKGGGVKEATYEGDAICFGTAACGNSTHWWSVPIDEGQTVGSLLWHEMEKAHWGDFICIFFFSRDKGGGAVGRARPFDFRRVLDAPRQRIHAPCTRRDAASCWLDMNLGSLCRLESGRISRQSVAVGLQGIATPPARRRGG